MSSNLQISLKTDVRSLAVARAISQIRGQLLYTVEYRLDSETFGEDREIICCIILKEEKLNDEERNRIRWRFGKEVHPSELFELYQILCLKLENPKQDLTFLRSDGDSETLELIMSSEMMVKIATNVQNIYIDKILMINEDRNPIKGASDRGNITTIAIGMAL